MKPVEQVWSPELAAHYESQGHWRGETFPALLRRWDALHPERIAIQDRTSAWTYGDLADRAHRFAAGLRKAGLQPGERVLVQMGNVPEFFQAVFGLFAAGLIPVYALPAHRRTELEHLARKSEAVGIITQSRIAGFDHAGLAQALADTIPALRHVFVADPDLENACAEPAALPEDPSARSVAFLQISGGSTGLSKLIPRTHDDYIYTLRESARICGLDAQSVYLAVLPVAHNFTMSSPGVFGTLYAGGRVVLAGDPRPETGFALIREHGVTMTALVPPLAMKWMDTAERIGADIPSLQVLQVGGAKFLPDAARRVAPVLGCTLQQVFGMAEGLVNYTRLDDDETTITETQGRPISPDDEILIVDDEDTPVAPDEAGHLLTRGPYTIRAYHDEPAANARSFTAEGFYRTGDIVRQLPTGHLVVQGRATDHINRAGEKISAEEIEDHLIAHPDVLDAVVVSVPDAQLGERTCAFILPRGGALEPAVLRRWMRGREIAAYKIPDEMRMVDELGTTAVGKISRRALRAQLQKDMTETEATT
ncbi:2,3-dihydroxybenzoate-AMP ligase [Poseidonocella pacifica]|uniref:2,3-dihydroxybenzoate-AMP ligase n=1 Tax=Poseidonocella pacifica TaxID=871651 RepID=A0A1I0WRT0_9RHOB|nr:AMP-binding protein [Poseidonocella pacifica]SFA90696.1 2,3-dihydroxybenzoate-AMP ligase [Poseidonocella pacifica]